MGNTQDKKWVSVWGNAMSITERTPATYGKDITFRYPVVMPFDGDGITCTFDNFCGREDVVLTHCAVSLGVGEEQVQPYSSVFLSFDGNRSVTIPAGKSVTSDPVSLQVRKGQLLTVSFYFKDFVDLGSGVTATGPLSRGNYAYGDFVEAEHLPVEHTRNTNVFYLLSDVSVLTKKENDAVICYGDSITAQSWPDYLALELKKQDEQTLSVVRKAASGTRILRQYVCATYASYGLKGDIRFPHEIPSVNGAKAIIIQQGINDIIHPVGTAENVFRPWSDLPTAEELCDGLKKYVAQAKELGLKVYLGTLLPIEGWRTYAPFREELRQKVNEFIRTFEEVDGVIDFDKVVHDEAHPTKFKEGFDSGDHLHPSDLAYREMAKEAMRIVLK